MKKTPRSLPGSVKLARGAKNCFAAVMLPNGRHFVRILKAYYDVSQKPPQVVRLDVRCFGGAPDAYGGYNGRKYKILDGFGCPSTGFVLVGGDIAPFSAIYEDAPVALTRLTDVTPKL